MPTLCLPRPVLPLLAHDASVLAHLAHRLAHRAPLTSPTALPTAHPAFLPTMFATPPPVLPVILPTVPPVVPTILPTAPPVLPTAPFPTAQLEPGKVGLACALAWLGCRAGSPRSDRA